LIRVKFNEKIVEISEGNCQWFETAQGRNRLLFEVSDMKDFPKVYGVFLNQDVIDNCVYYDIFMSIRGTEHKVILKYASNHPISQIDVTIAYPKLDTRRMSHHWYAPDKPCYLELWSSNWTALKTATQIRSYLEDYYDGSYAKENSQPQYVINHEGIRRFLRESKQNNNFHSYSSFDVDRETREILREISKKSRWWRF